MFQFYVYSDQPATNLAKALVQLERRVFAADGDNPVVISVPAREDQHGDYTKIIEAHGFSVQPRRKVRGVEKGTPKPDAEPTTP